MWWNVGNAVSVQGGGGGDGEMSRVKISVLDAVQETKMANDARQRLLKRKFLWELTKM
jgi:hypothetical protein